MRLRSAHVEYMNYLAPVHIEVKARMMRRQQTGNAYSSCVTIHVCIRRHSLPAVWDFHQHHLLRGIFINHKKSDSNTTNKHVRWIICVSNIYRLLVYVPVLLCL